jgi:hypothetical protein
MAAVSPQFSMVNNEFRKIGRERIEALIRANLLTDSTKGKRIDAKVQSLALGIQGLITGLGFMAGTEPAADYGNYKRIATQLSAKLIDEADL